jgi:hypothetical protein
VGRSAILRLTQCWDVSFVRRLGKCVCLVAGCFVAGGFVAGGRSGLGRQRGKRGTGGLTASRRLVLFCVNSWFVSYYAVCRLASSRKSESPEEEKVDGGSSLVQSSSPNNGRFWNH